MPSNLTHPGYHRSGQPLVRCRFMGSSDSRGKPSSPPKKKFYIFKDSKCFFALQICGMETVNTTDKVTPPLLALSLLKTPIHCVGVSVTLLNWRRQGCFRHQLGSTLQQTMLPRELARLPVCTFSTNDSESRGAETSPLI